MAAEDVIELGVIKYNKLVRDRIPEICEADGKQALTRQLSLDEYLSALDLKLVEEMNEYIESGNVEELADILEIMHAILDIKGMDFAKLDLIRKRKRTKRGGFENRIFLIETREMDDNK